jgi:hypothetical protein
MDSVAKEVTNAAPAAEGAGRGAAAPASAEERRALIRAQVEYWFSRENLSRDYFLVQHISANILHNP